MDESSEQRLARLDHAHVWHPFTPMRQWRQQPPLIIESAEGFELVTTDGRRLIDGVSSLWCNVHGHRVPAIDQAIRDQLEKVAHSTLLGLSSPPAIELAAKLAEVVPGPADRVFYSDAGATAVEVAFKMAVGSWYHRGEPQRNRLIGVEGAYHGDTTGSMSVGYSPLFHRPFERMLFETDMTPAPDAMNPPTGLELEPLEDLRIWPSEDERRSEALRTGCLERLETLLKVHDGATAAIVVEPVIQGAAGMVAHPDGYLAGVAALAREYGTLLIADEVATGFGRTGPMFACEREGVEPDIICLAKGISGGYLPLAATVATAEIEQAFCGEPEERRTLYHGHT
ncbi:MAG: aminotransferase class III-fold pyridoxal phosphate-dependent enzyme, partial [Phycisphaeraceae bacterium]|nr:aminotransferase class III-fold pyridoxal phosphate-dependent enzyme [Phycisphaeraceae bacterium]